MVMIATGVKNARKLEAPLTDQDTSGRWRCLLCRPVRWRRGTLRQAHYHYTDIHHQTGDNPG